MGELQPALHLDPANEAEFILFDQELQDRYGEAFRSIDERCLTEIDHLYRFMRDDGTCPDEVLEAVQINLMTAVKEAAMPYAVSTTHQEYRDGTFWWLDQTPRQVAESGYKFHKHPAAIERVHVEVAEADDIEHNLRPGFIKILISPKMSSKDAPYEVAKSEHLGDDDMIRIHMLNCDDDGQVKGKYMQSVLVRDVPLEAWVRMFQDSNNIFGRSFELRDPESALSIMELHKDLELPAEALPEGTVSLIDAVLPYLDKEQRRKVESQLLLFRDDQESIHQKAELIAARWLHFELEMAKSLKQGVASEEVQRFVFGLQHEWGEDTLNVLQSLSRSDGGFSMTRELAVRIEKAKQKTLWVSAAVVTQNQEVIKQLDEGTVQQIYVNEMLIQQMMQEGYSHHDIRAIETSNNQIVASQEVAVGGGCAGDNNADLGPSKNGPDGSSSTASEATGANGGSARVNSQGKEKWKWKSGVCRINECPSRPRTTLVGPCEVCTCCQRIFDNGGNPSMVYGKGKSARVDGPAKKAAEAQAAAESDPDFDKEAREFFAEEEPKRPSAAGSLAVANA
ncbi:MAG TPA: hypothetical protein VFT16_02135 [Candidatus Saccharimonadales bacterium]|nr:hypothetical protein [Candidatus Saccharimonadales bacterium]